MGETVIICEVGPRDGLQIAKTIMPTAAKLRWIAAMAAAGVREIEVGSFVSPKLLPQLADTGAIVPEALKLEGLTVVALAPNMRGAMDAYAAGVHRISIPVSVTEGHSRANLNRSPAEQVAEVARIIAWVRAQPRPMQIEASCSTVFGCSFDGRVKVTDVLRVTSALVEAGITGLALADTVGYGNPALIRDVVRSVRAEIGPVLEGLHLHDTMGLGLANALAGLEAGIRNFDSALAGLGGCPFAPGASGNIVTEDLVFMLESMGFTTGIDLDRLIAAREVLQDGLPAEPRHGNLARAGIPATYRAAA